MVFSPRGVDLGNVGERLSNAGNEKIVVADLRVGVHGLDAVSKSHIVVAVEIGCEIKGGAVEVGLFESRCDGPAHVAQIHSLVRPGWSSHGSATSCVEDVCLKNAAMWPRS